MKNNDIKSKDSVSFIVSKLLHVLGQDIEREGLRDTPRRVEKFYKEFLTEDEFTTTTFLSEGYDEMISQCNIPFYSLCEHHMVPFFGVAHVAYIPSDRIVGLSKFSRIIDHFAHGLQNQERITTEVTEYLDEKLSPRGVAVSLTARHLCMEMRGVRKYGAQTTTTSLRGVFKSDAMTRGEFFAAINSQAREI